MMTRMNGSPVQVFRLSAQAAPNGGLIAMEGTKVVATAISHGDYWTVEAGDISVATIRGNSSVVASFLHGLFLGSGGVLQYKAE